MSGNPKRAFKPKAANGDLPAIPKFTPAKSGGSKVVTAPPEPSSVTSIKTYDVEPTTTGSVSKTPVAVKPSSMVVSTMTAPVPVTTNGTATGSVTKVPAKVVKKVPEPVKVAPAPKVEKKPDPESEESESEDESEDTNGDKKDSGSDESGTESEDDKDNIKDEPLVRKSVPKPTPKPTKVTSKVKSPTPVIVAAPTIMAEIIPDPTVPITIASSGVAALLDIVRYSLDEVLNFDLSTFIKNFSNIDINTYTLGGAKAILSHAWTLGVFSNDKEVCDKLLTQVYINDSRIHDYIIYLYNIGMNESNIFTYAHDVTNKELFISKIFTAIGVGRDRK